MYTHHSHTVLHITYCHYIQFCQHPLYYFFFFFNDTATTEIYTLSLHDALPISDRRLELRRHLHLGYWFPVQREYPSGSGKQDRKSTRLNSSHSQISYAVFCLKKKKKMIKIFR